MTNEDKAERENMTIESWTKGQEEREQGRKK